MLSLCLSIVSSSCVRHRITIDASTQLTLICCIRIFGIHARTRLCFAYLRYLWLSLVLFRWVFSVLRTPRAANLYEIRAHSTWASESSSFVCIFFFLVSDGQLFLLCIIYGPMEMCWVCLSLKVNKRHILLCTAIGVWTAKTKATLPRIAINFVSFDAYGTHRTK